MTEGMGKGAAAGAHGRGHNQWAQLAGVVVYFFNKLIGFHCRFEDGGDEDEHHRPHVSAMKILY